MTAQQDPQSLIDEIERLLTAGTNRLPWSGLETRQRQVLEQVQQYLRSQPTSLDVTAQQQIAQIVRQELQAWQSQTPLPTEVLQRMTEMVAQVQSQWQRQLEHLLTMAPQETPLANDLLTVQQRWQQLLHLQRQSDQLLKAIDTNQKIIFTSLQQQAQAYHYSLAEKLRELHQMGIQAEAIANALIQKLADRLEQEISNLPTAAPDPGAVVYPYAGTEVDRSEVIPPELALNTFAETIPDSEAILEPDAPAAGFDDIDSIITNLQSPGVVEEPAPVNPSEAEQTYQSLFNGITDLELALFGEPPAPEEPPEILIPLEPPTPEEPPEIIGSLWELLPNREPPPLTSPPEPEQPDEPDELDPPGDLLQTSPSGAFTGVPSPEAIARLEQDLANFAAPQPAIESDEIVADRQDVEPGSDQPNPPATTPTEIPGLIDLPVQMIAAETPATVPEPSTEIVVDELVLESNQPPIPEKSSSQISQITDQPLDQADSQTVGQIDNQVIDAPADLPDIAPELGDEPATVENSHQADPAWLEADLAAEDEDYTGTQTVIDEMRSIPGLWAGLEDFAEPPDSSSPSESVLIAQLLLDEAIDCHDPQLVEAIAIESLSNQMPSELHPLEEEVEDDTLTEVPNDEDAPPSEPDKDLVHQDMLMETEPNIELSQASSNISSTIDNVDTNDAALMAIAMSNPGQTITDQPIAPQDLRLQYNLPQGPSLDIELAGGEQNSWYLGVDVGTTHISAALLNKTSGGIYPLQWGDENESFRLPMVAYAGDPDQGLVLQNFKPYLRLGIPYQTDQQWQPVVQLGQNQPPVSILELQKSLATLLVNLRQHSGAILIPAQALEQVWSRLAGVIVNCPIAWGEAYCWNVREAILEAGLVSQPEQVLFVEEAIAPFLAGLQIRGHSDQGGDVPFPWRGHTLVINAGASNTELALVNTEPGNHLVHSDLVLWSFAYAGHAIDQDIICQLLLNPEAKLLNRVYESETLLLANDLELPQPGTPDTPRREKLQFWLQGSPWGQKLLIAAQTLKLHLQHKTEHRLILGGDQWLVTRQMYETQVVIPFLQQLNQQLNSLLSYSGVAEHTIYQVLCAGETLNGSMLTNWLKIKLPQAMAITSIGTPAWVAAGLASLPLAPQLFNQTQRYSDYFLLMELLRTVAESAKSEYSTAEVLQLLERRGINTRACRDRLIDLLNGQLPKHLIPDITSPWLALTRLPDYDTQIPLFTQTDSQLYQVDRTQCERLFAHLQALSGPARQKLEEPLIFDL